MVIFGVHVSEEAITSAAFAVIGFLVAVNFWIRAKSRKIEANAKEIEAKAKNIEAEATVKVSAAEAELAERQFIMEAYKNQLLVNDQLKDNLTKQNRGFLVSLKQIRAEKESDYKTLKRLGEDNTRMIMTEVQQSKVSVVNRLESLETSIVANNASLLETVASDFAVVLVQKMQEQMKMQNQYPFPSIDDPEWVEDFTKPIVNRVSVYSRPYASDGTKIPAEIKAEGENLKVYRGWKKDWVAIRFIRGTEALFGWIQEHEVVIGLNAMKLSTSEQVAITTSNAVPAAT